MSSTHTCDVAVIGLGAIGSAVLWQLAKRGVKVVGLDRFAPPHRHGSSPGDPRITRQAIGEGNAYVPLARRSHEIWDEIENLTGRRLFDRCGFILIGSPDSRVVVHGKPSFFRSTVDAARRYQIPHELLDPAAIATSFPQFTGLADADEGYFEPDAGYLRPEACVGAQLSLAVSAGAEVRFDARARALVETGGSVKIRAAGGDIDASRAVICAGAWTRELLEPALARLLTVFRQTLHWFPVSEPDLFRPGHAPVFIRLHGSAPEDQFYGFPPLDGEGSIKIAEEVYSDVVDPEASPPAALDDAARRAFDSHVSGRLRGVTREPTRSLACLYTNTPDGDFLIVLHPEHERFMVVSACSGHGFKHSAALGEAVAQSVLGQEPAIDLSTFGFSRFV